MALALQELDSATGADALRAALADVELHVAVLQGHGAEEAADGATRFAAARCAASAGSKRASVARPFQITTLAPR